MTLSLCTSIVRGLWERWEFHTKKLGSGSEGGHIWSRLFTSHEDSTAAKIKGRALKTNVHLGRATRRAGEGGEGGEWGAQEEGGGTLADRYAKLGADAHKPTCYVSLTVWQVSGQLPARERDRPQRCVSLCGTETGSTSLRARKRHTYFDNQGPVLSTISGRVPTRRGAVRQPRLWVSTTSQDGEVNDGNCREKRLSSWLTTPRSGVSATTSTVLAWDEAFAPRSSQTHALEIEKLWTWRTSFWILGRTLGRGRLPCA